MTYIYIYIYDVLIVGDGSYFLFVQHPTYVTYEPTYFLVSS